MLHTLVLTASLALGTPAGPGAAAPDGAIPADPTPGERQSDASAQPAGEQKDLEELVARLQKLGLQITADPKRIGATTSEAAYFMFADRKDHRPRCRPLETPEKGHWLDGKPVFTSKADRDAVRPLFDRLVERMGYNEVCVYSADVRYGVDSHARFTLYKLGYRPDDERRGKQPEVLLGDAEYVLGL